MIGIKRNYDDSNEDLLSAEIEFEGSSVKVSMHGLFQLITRDVFTLQNLIRIGSVSTWEFNFHRILNHYFFRVPFSDKK